MCVGEYVGGSHLLFDTLPPHFFVYSADDHIFIANTVEGILCKYFSQQMYNFMFVGYEQVAVAAIATRVIESDQMLWINVD